MRLLWVKAGGLVPLNVGGHIRSFHLMKALAERHEITLFTFYPEHPDDKHDELSAVFDRVVALPLPIPTGRGPRELASYIRHLLSGQPFALAKHCRPEVKASLRELVEADAFDVIVCDFLVPAPVIPWSAESPKVIFTHNVEAAIWKRHYSVARNPLWKAVCWREHRTTARAERHYLSRAEHVVAVSDADKKIFARYLEPSKITVVPTGVDLDYFHPSEGQESPSRLAFTGSMDWTANEDAMIYFMKEILPGVRREIADVELFIVGRKPSERLHAVAAGQDGVTVTGEVDDIRPFVHAAPVFVVPLRIGGGTRLKIFEAMAMGKAIVSTTVGAEGLPVSHEENIVLADQPAEFAQHVVSLLRDRERRSRLGRRARELVEKRYGWAAVSKYFDQALLAAIRRFGKAQG